MNFSTQCFLSFLFGIVAALISLKIESILKAKMLRSIYGQICSLYFCGHRLDRVIESEFFIRYHHLVDCGFCAATSALAMLALRENHTARIVRGYWQESTERLFHSWVEFRYAGRWYVLDPSWVHRSAVILRRKHRKHAKVTVVTTCTYDEFWSIPVSEQFYQKLQHPESSYLFYEIYTTYTWWDGTESESIPNLTKDAALEEDAGFSLSFDFPIRSNDVLFSRRIFNEYMAKPTRRHPKAKTLRRFYKYRKLLRRDYFRFLQEECDLPEDTLARISARWSEG